MRRFADVYDGKPVVIEEKEDKTVIASPYPTEHEETSRIYLHTFGPRAGENFLLFVHGLGRYNVNFLKWFPKFFAKHGFSSALMILPYHFERTPKGYRSGELFLNTTDNDTLRSRFEHAVVDVLASFDHFRSRFERVFLMGYSFGGMVSVIASAFRNPKALSLVVTGGNFLYITWESIATRYFRIQYEENDECDIEKCRYWHSEENFYEYIRTLNDPRIELDSSPMKCYEYDPLVFAKFVRSPVIFFSAMMDFFIPRESSEELFRMLGSDIKKRHRLLAGHVGSFLLWRHYIARKTIEFFREVSS